LEKLNTSRENVRVYLTKLLNINFELKWNQKFVISKRWEEKNCAQLLVKVKNPDCLNSDWWWDVDHAL